VCCINCCKTSPRYAVTAQVARPIVTRAAERKHRAGSLTQSAPFAPARSGIRKMVLLFCARTHNYCRDSSFLLVSVLHRLPVRQQCSDRSSARCLSCPRDCLSPIGFLDNGQLSKAHHRIFKRGRCSGRKRQHTPSEIFSENTTHAMNSAWARCARPSPTCSDAQRWIRLIVRKSHEF
jgi:hypothetical protein